MPVTFTTAIDETRSVSSYANLSSSTVQELISLGVTPSSHSKAITSDVSRVTKLPRGVASGSAPGSSAVDSLIALGVTPTSHSKSSISSSLRVVSLNEEVTSHATASTSTAIRVVSINEDVTSHSKTVASGASRGGKTQPRVTDSYATKFSSFSYNERVSLEVIDHEIIWDEEEAVWYTNWFKESKILGDEDSLAIRSLVVDDAKEPCATVVVQYDADGNGSVDEQSEPIELARNQMVHDINEIPVDEDGHYRMKIMEYSGYNSLYALDFAIVH